MLYHLIKPLAQTWFKIFFRKIFYTNAHILPRPGEKPLIFAVNHPTAFLDPVLVAAFLPHIVHFMLRGDVFTTRFYRWLLGQIKTIPIFRARDGFRSLKNNQVTFDRCYKILSEKKNILILAEGKTKHEKRMRPIQKGTARMAFGAYEAYGVEDIMIVPVGVNYTDSHSFRSDVMVDIGPLIPLKDYLEEYKENPRKAVKHLTEEISKRMKERIVHIDDPADDKFVDHLLMMNRNFKQESILPAIVRGHTWLWEEKEIANKVNKMRPGQKEQLKQKTEAYFDQLAAHKVEDVSVAKSRYYNWINSLILVLGFIPFLIGFIPSFPPVGFARWLADRVVKKIEFHSSVRFAVGFITYFLYAIAFFVLALVTGKEWWIAGVVVMPFLGYLSLLYRDLWKKYHNARRFNMLDKATQEALRNARASLTNLADLSRAERA